MSKLHIRSKALSLAFHLVRDVAMIISIFTLLERTIYLISLPSIRVIDLDPGGSLRATGGGGFVCKENTQNIPTRRLEHQCGHEFFSKGLSLGHRNRLYVESNNLLRDKFIAWILDRLRHRPRGSK